MADTDPAPTSQPLPELHTLVVGREAMACRFEVVFNAGEVPDATELGLAALDLVDSIEDRITVYRESSKLARLNATAAEGWQPVAGDVVALLTQARRLHEKTGGAFDPAAGSLVRAWGFLRRQGRTPDAAMLASAREQSGMAHVEIDEHAGRVRFTRPGIELNLGAIGKGWALDAVIGMLTAAGVGSVLVHGGSSSVRAVGVQGPTLPGRRGWRVGVRHPLRPGRRLATFTLVDAALGTSGSGTQFFVDRGRRLEGVLSATVITPQAADADALSTALYVLGPAGLERIAPAGGDTAAILVVPSRNPASVRVLTANLDPDLVEWDPGEGLEVVRVV